MSTSYIVLSALVGWCGTLWPHWWRVPRPPRPYPDPEPWWRPSVVAIAGGVVGGYVITWFATLSVAIVAVGAFGGGLAALAIDERWRQNKRAG
jgi:hypothetical protein